MARPPLIEATPETIEARTRGTMTMHSRRMKRSPTQPTVSAAPSPKIRPVTAPRSMAPSTCQWTLRYQMWSWLMSIGF